MTPLLFLARSQVVHYLVRCKCHWDPPPAGVLALCPRSAADLGLWMLQACVSE